MDTNESRQTIRARPASPPDDDATRTRRDLPLVGDDTSVNMTPMIDMTFLLVVFFMLSIDLTQKEYLPVDLPFAYEGVEDLPQPDETIPRFVVNLESDGTVMFKGRRYSLSADRPEAQEAALGALRSQLRSISADPQYREPTGASRIPVLIHGDRAAKWKYAQYVMQVCAHPDIRIYQVQFAVTKPASDDASEER